MPTPWSREGPDSPERLFERLSQGPDPNTHVPPVPPGRRAVDKETLFSSGIKHPDDAYRAYNDALAVAGGREVAIWYRTDTGEYAVTIGTFGAVGAPDKVKPWIAIVHFHPNEHRSLTLRLPAPKSDFKSLWERSRFEEGVVREIVEWDMPDGTRGRTEYGIDMSHPSQPLYIRTSQPDGTLGPPQRFSEKAYGEHHAARTHFIEKGSPLHKELVPQKGDKQQPDANRRTAMPPASGGGDGDGPRSRETSVTQPYPTIKQLGPYTYSSQEVTDGTTAHWRIWNWARTEKSKVLDRGPQHFLDQLLDQARGAGHDMLVLTIENIEADSVKRLAKPGSPMARHLGATAVEPINDTTIRMVIPLGGRPKGGGTGSASGGGAAPRALMVAHDPIDPAVESDTVVRGVAPEGPSAMRTSGAGPDDVTTRHPSGVPTASPTETTHQAPLESKGNGNRRRRHRPGTLAKARATERPCGCRWARTRTGPNVGRAEDRVVVGGPGREPGRTSDAPKDPVVVGGFGRGASRPPDVPETLSPSDGVPIPISGPDDTTGVRTNPVPRPDEAVPEHIDDGPNIHRPPTQSPDTPPGSDLAAHAEQHPAGISRRVRVDTTGIDHGRRSSTPSGTTNEVSGRPTVPRPRPSPDARRKHRTHSRRRHEKHLRRSSAERQRRLVRPTSSGANGVEPLNAWRRPSSA